MRGVAFLALGSMLFLDAISALPVREKPAEEENKEVDQEELVDKLSYEKYLREVMSVLMTDTDFAQKMMKIQDIAGQSGEIAKHLEFVSHGVRSKLDEIKRKEVQRLKQITKLQEKLKNGMNMALSPAAAAARGIDSAFQEKAGILDSDKHLKHIDHANSNTFEVEDLAKLIQQATTDLEDLDKERRSDFKTYEMEKEHLQKEELKALDEQARAAKEKELHDKKEKHKKHAKVNHPGNMEQLEEVWEETDNLDRDDFNPKTFFHLHDVDGDGYWDEQEIEALFQKELDKVYDPNAEEDDMMERFEEMNRMREHVMKEIDTDGDKLVSMEEFVASTNRDEFKENEEWETIDEDEEFTDEELEKFEEDYEAARRQMQEEQERRENERRRDMGEEVQMNQGPGGVHPAMAQRGQPMKVDAQPPPVPTAGHNQGQGRQQPIHHPGPPAHHRQQATNEHDPTHHEQSNPQEQSDSLKYAHGRNAEQGGAPSAN
ncbi:hypothetical protein CAPTEDRAFT_183512 [Capitella teleta]|uniref:NUCB1-like N-terminal domain-containing protein n=1 Tax=Capitella teleta TaxID=283909 RepID=R7TV04_CAPTE|nr:hypothetical protein CAPTEDRAFT_183512 [Capitella teleta]|eukprot:ELT97554.1 hypothetical protein CAPTEDRAFT_183512 [Capitella teleta]